MAQNGKSRGLCPKSVKILRLLHHSSEGLTFKDIVRQLAIPKRTIYNHLESLKKKGLVTNDYPIWHCATFPTGSSKMAHLLSSDKIQAHKFSFVLRLVHKPTWWERRANYLIRLGLECRKVQWVNSYLQIVKGAFLLQIFKNSIIFINQKKYWASDAYDAFIEALEDTMEAYGELEQSTRFRFFKEGVPQFSLRSANLVKLKDAIADRCKKERRMFRIEKDGQLRAYIDLSEPFGLEFGHKDYCVEDARRYTQVVNDYIEKNAPLPSEVQESILYLMKSQAMLQNEVSMMAKAMEQQTEIISSLVGLLMPSSAFPEAFKVDDSKNRKLGDYIG